MDTNSSPRNPQPQQLPEANPVGVYQRDIEIPADWDGRDIFLRLEGAKSGVYVYVNGQEVGYSEDSKNPAEFLINNYLKPPVKTRWSLKYSAGVPVLIWNARILGA